MPEFKLPPIEKAEDAQPVSAPAVVAGDMDEWRRRITVPANSAILDAFMLDDEVDVTLRGKVIGLRNSQSKEYNDQNIEIEITSVSAYPANSAYEDEEMGMDAGYNEG